MFVGGNLHAHACFPTLPAGLDLALCFLCKHEEPVSGISFPSADPALHLVLDLQIPKEGKDIAKAKAILNYTRALHISPNKHCPPSTTMCYYPV